MEIIKQYLSLIDGIKLISLFSLIGIDFILGVVLAIINKKFEWKKLAGFLNTSVLQLTAGYFLVGIAALANSSFEAAIWATWVIIDAKLIADITAKFKQLGVIFQKKA